MGDWLTVLATVCGFIGIVLMIAYGLPKLRDDRPLDDYLVGIVALVLFGLATAVIIALIIPLT